jgi:hypothetical protein
LNKTNTIAKSFDYPAATVPRIRHISYEFSLVNDDAAISEKYLAKITKDYNRKMCEFHLGLSAYHLKQSSFGLFVYYGWDHFLRNTKMFFINVSYSK